MENNSSKYKLQRLRYFNSRNNIKTFLQRTRRNKQRLIPLTREIQKAMMDFNGSQSSTSVSERPFDNTTSITRLVRDEINNILHELSISEQFVRKRDINEIIEKCLKITLIQDCDNKEHAISGDTFEMTVEEMTADKEINKIIQNINVLDRRITMLEKQNIPKIQHIQDNRLKTNNNVFKEKVNALCKMDTRVEVEKPEDKGKLQIDAYTNKNIPHNMYDEIFYTNREYTINVLNYKKSLETLELNQKPRWNPYVKPLISALSSEDKFKKRSMFLSTNDGIKIVN